MRNQVSRMRTLRVLVGVAALSALPSACTSDSVMDVRPEVDVGATTGAVPRLSGMQSLIPNDPYLSQAAYPRPDSMPLERSPPAEKPTGTDERQTFPEPMTPEEPDAALEDPAPLSRPEVARPEPAPAVMPPDQVACRQDLKRLGVTYRDLPAVHGPGSCGIDWPVEVSAMGSVRMKPAATLSCDMAATFSAWTKNELVPQARWRYWSGVKAIHQGSSYSCRTIRGSGTPSQHGKGNALDVMSIELNNGSEIDVRKPGWFSFRQRGFLNTVRADGCQYFSTTLGPGYNADHANHFHFDIMPRRSGHIACR